MALFPLIAASSNMSSPFNRRGNGYRSKSSWELPGTSSDYQFGRKLQRGLNSWHSTGHLDKKGTKARAEPKTPLSRKWRMYAAPCVNGFLKGAKAIKTASDSALSIIKPRKRLESLISPIIKRKQHKKKRDEEAQKSEFFEKMKNNASDLFTLVPLATAGPSGAQDKDDDDSSSSGCLCCKYEDSDSEGGYFWEDLFGKHADDKK